LGLAVRKGCRSRCKYQARLPDQTVQSFVTEKDMPPLGHHFQEAPPVRALGAADFEDVSVVRIELEREGSRQEG